MKILFKKFNVFIWIIVMLYSEYGSSENFNFPEFSKVLPKFSKVLPKNLLIEVDNKILNYQKTVGTVINKSQEQLTWEHIMQPLEDAGAELDQIINMTSHLHAVKDNQELREVYSKILPKLTKFNADILQNKQLHQKILQLSRAEIFKQLNIAQQKIIENLLLDFKLAGVDLTQEQQTRYKEITTNLSKLSDEFSKNVLDATQSWTYYISPNNKQQLNGLPEYFMAIAKQNAIKHAKPDGWVVTLDAPSVDLVLRYAKDQELRKIVYKAQVTKASEQFPKEFIKFDNSKIMQDIIKLRYELAILLGFKNYSEYSLSRKIAKSTKEVLNFLDELAVKSVPIAKKEFLKLQEFAKSKDQIIDLQPWDITYYAEQYKEHLYNLPSEELRNYFALSKVLSGMFNLVNKLYGINVKEIHEFDSWDPMVKLYQVTDNQGKLYGFFYMDLYVRDNKQSGAWMGSCLSRHKQHNSNLQHPIAFLITNFNQSVSNDPLLYHHEVVTLLHEFGHVLHHILTQVDYISVAGCNGVSWDAVELPSQFMEKWAYDWDFLNSVAIHNQTKQPISKEQFNSLIKIKNYNAGMFMVRQLEFAIFDFTLHMWSSDENHLLPNVQQFLDLARAKVTVVPVAKFNRFQHGFSHIFAGGYAAGYYSYSWAEVLASDAYMAFHDPKHINKVNFQKDLGKKFLENILQMGGSKDAMDLYISFRANKPNINSLLEYNGLASNNN